MQFGITGGPAEFGFTVGQHMHDLIADSTCENFVDDGGSAADSFEEGMAKLCQILDHVHREKLSLSPSKLQVFMTEAVFAGAHVGPEGGENTSIMEGGMKAYPLDYRESIWDC